MIADRKKKKVSKRNKTAWRKHTDVQDVEDFLEDKRAEERLGVDKISTKENSELFVVDTEAFDEKKFTGKPRTKAEKKLWSLEPSHYQLALIPRSAVQDPIQRNRVKSKEERQHPARKAKDAALAAKGKLRYKQQKSAEDRKRSLINNKKRLIKQRADEVNFNIDVWKEEESVVDDSWLSEDAKRQLKISCKEFKVKPPVDLSKRRSNLPVVESPHPGLSYNPSLADHKDLISKVVDKEVKMMKKDAHIARVTAPFRKSSAIKQDDWVEEVMQSLGMGSKDEETKLEIKEEKEDEEDDKSKVVLAKKKQAKMKTKKQRRTQLRLRDEAQQRKYAAVEKRKISDIYQLRAIVSNLDEISAVNEKKSAVKREAKCEYASVGTKRLSKVKFEEPLEDFTTAGELSGSLRKLRAKSTILRDRFYSLQRRNILQPTTKIFKTKKRKVKAFVKRDHRIEEEQTHKAKTKKNKLKIINTDNWK